MVDEKESTASAALPATLRALIEGGADDDVAILAVDREPLTFALLRHHVSVIGEQLHRLGIRRNDRVAIMLPNGPELATAFLAVAASAAAAPLNPGYKLDELMFFLSDLQPKALIVSEPDSTISVAASRLNIPLFGLSVPSGAPAGVFQLASARMPSRDQADDTGFAEPDDVALLLHTSGTTARPKLVPLSQRNLCTSARQVSETLALTPADRCLNVMPLFHIHGLVGAVLSSMAAGASVACTPGFNAFRFFDWIRAVRPTWYTAVPSMHQAVVQRADRHRATLQASPLRLVRSSSAPLAPAVMRQLEDVFAAPVLEAYGMTEGAHQIASNPLPPRSRVPGTVGVATGTEIAIMSETGQLAPVGESGEVVIRGATVMRGYLDNPTANAEAFVDGWFRTGDQGVLDANGYLTLTGRLKEIINRGGEKISPREIDLVLLEHPAVEQVVTFALPHELLGEEVAAAVVLRGGVDARPQELRAFAAERLADFKVPRKVLVLDQIPTGPTGKLQRIGLAARLGLTG